MKSITIEGQEGYFLSKEEYFQLKQTLNSVGDRLQRMEMGK